MIKFIDICEIALVFQGNERKLTLKKEKEKKRNSSCLEGREVYSHQNISIITAVA